MNSYIMKHFDDEFIAMNKEYFDFLIKDNLKYMGESLLYALAFYGTMFLVFG